MRSRAILAGALLATAGCAAGKLEITVSNAASRDVRLIVISPTVLRFDAPAYRSFELAVDEVDSVLASGRFMVLGPDEFTRTLEPVPDSKAVFPFHIMGKVAALGLAVPEVATLASWVERREEVGSRQRTDPKGRVTGRSRSGEVTYVVHEDLSIFDRAGNGETLVSASLELTVDPFAEHPPSDDAPELRQAVKTLVAEVLRKALPVLKTSSQINQLPFRADWIPWNEEPFSMIGRPALQARLATLDPVSAEAERLLRLSYFEPDLSSARQNAMLALPAGLLVSEVPNRLRASGLEPGDLITAVESDPVGGPQTFLRWASAKPPGSPIQLTLLRRDQVVQLAVPSPER